MERLHILDGYGYIFRAYFGMAGPGRGVRLSTADGLPTGALYVYTSMLIRLHQEERPERIVVVFDAPGKNFRDELSEEYKATRRETPDDLKQQFPYFRPLTEAFHWPVVSVPGVEADDTIATIAHEAVAKGWEVVIHSGDKDLMQLVDDKIKVVDSMRRITYDAAKVEDKFGVPPAQLGDWLALVGDKSDNVPGMPGVGKVGATKLLKSYGSIEGILDHVGDMKGKQKERFSSEANLEQLRLSKTLVTLKTDVKLPEDLESFRPSPWDGSELAALCHRFEFTALLERLGAKGAEVTSDEEHPVDMPPARALTEAAEIRDFAALAKTKGRVCVHAEGDGSRHDRETLVSLSLSVEGEEPVYLPVAHRYLGAPPALSADTLAPIDEILRDEGIEIVCWGSKRLRELLGRTNLGLAGVSMDAMLAAYLLDPSANDKDAAICLNQVLGTTLAERESITGKGKKAVSWEQVEVGRACQYSGPVVAALHQVNSRLEHQLDQEGMLTLLRELEIPLARVLAEIELRGILLDLDVLEELRDEVGGRISKLENQVFELAGGPFNLGSPKQLSKVLFETLGLTSEVMKKTKTGFSTDHEVLEGMVDAHEIIAPIMEHRELVKLKGTYIDALPPMVNPKTGRLHTSFRQTVAATGRLSSQDPNLQNIPIRTELGRKIRKAFVAPQGRMLLSADYSQIELRIMAHLSEDPVLVKAFNSGVDVHSQTAAEVFGKAVDEVSRNERRIAKAVNYGLIYGQSEFGLARALGIPRYQAKEYIARYFERFAKVRSFMDDIVSSAREAGAAFTVCGRKRPIPGISHKNYRIRSQAERVAQNTPMQGSAADIMKLAMLDVDRVLREDYPKARMLLTVHDELVVEVEEEQAAEVGDALKASMEGAYELRVPLVVDVGMANNWCDAH